MNPRIVLALIVVSWMFHDAQSAPLSYIPQTVVQPNGDTLHVFASGDEYNNWLHDKDGFTIVQDPLTGYYTYAVKSKTDNGIGASKFIVGQKVQVESCSDPL